MSLYHIDTYRSYRLFEQGYPDLVALNGDFYSRFEENEINKYDKEWTLFDALFLLGMSFDRYNYENINNINIRSNLDSFINHIPTIIRFRSSYDDLNNIYNRLVTLNRAPNSYPFNVNIHSKYLIVTSLGGDIDNNTIPDNRRGAFYMLTPENYNTNEIYERMYRELNNGTLYPESADVLFRYRSRIVLDLASESRFSFGGNINIYEINNINQLPQDKINTNLFYVAFLIGKYFDTDRFFRQYPIKNKLIPYDPENIYTWIPRNITMMIAYRRDIRSNLRLPIHELLKLEDEKDASYINRIKSGQINNEHMEEILLYFSFLGNDVDALSHLNVIDLQKILELYVKIPSLELHRNRVSETVTITGGRMYWKSETFYNYLVKNIKPILNNRIRDDFTSKIVGYPFLVNYETYKELSDTDYSILRSLYIIKGCPIKTALLTSKTDTLAGLVTGQMYPIKNYLDKSYLSNYIDLIHERIRESPITDESEISYNFDVDFPTYYIYSIIADYPVDMIKGLIEVNTDNVDSLARLYGISLEFLNYSNINPNDLPDQKVRNFRNIIVTMASYFDKQTDRSELSLNNVKNINVERYNDFELLALFNLNPIYTRTKLLNTYKIIGFTSLSRKISISSIPILLRNENTDSVHFLNMNDLTISEELTINYRNKITEILTALESSIYDRYKFEEYATNYNNLRNNLFPDNRMQ